MIHDARRLLILRYNAVAILGKVKRYSILSNICTLNFWVFSEHQNGVNSLQLCGHLWGVNLRQESVTFTP